MKRNLFLLVFVAFLSCALAQNDNPVSVRLEIFVVSEVDGEETFQASDTARPGQVVEYRLFARNESETTLPAGTVVITGPVPDGTTFIANSATPTNERILTEFSVNSTDFGEPPLIVESGDERRAAEPADYRAARWTLLEPLEPGSEEPFIYRVTVDGS